MRTLLAIGLALTSAVAAAQVVDDHKLKFQASAQALPLDATQLRRPADESAAHETRRPGASAYQSGFFDGFVVAAVDAFGERLCLPKAWSHGQARAVVAAALRAQPEASPQAAYDVAYAALAAAFPCPLPPR